MDIEENSIFSLAVKLAYKNKDYKQIVSVLINLGADPTRHAKEYAKSFNEAIE